MRNRLHALCPYFAMFPETFVAEHLATLTHEGDHVFDPFSGRGTTALQSLLMERHATAVDINPVAFCVTGAKVQAPDLHSVTEEINELSRNYTAADRTRLNLEYSMLPPFYHRAFHEDTLNQLLFLRGILNWRHDSVHRFISAMTLGILHGEMGRSRRYLSNQMPRTISPKPAYSLRYWEARNLWPEKKDVFRNLTQEATLRLSGDLPNLRGHAVLADARESSRRLASLVGKVGAIITSPPYFNVTNFEEDQWLRLWFLGHEPRVTIRQISKDDRYENKQAYWSFLADVWHGLALLPRPGAVLVCRIGGKGMSPSELTEGLMKTLGAAFPGGVLVSPPTVTHLQRRQTNAFRPGSIGCEFEVDHVFRLSE